MQEISQKELLLEGFLDTIRKISSPIAKSVAGAAGLAKGIAKVAAPNLSREVGSDIDQLKSIGTGAKAAFTSEKNKQINSTPSRYVKNELQTNWSSTFDPASIKITKEKKASPYSHNSFQLSKINSFVVYFDANKYNAGKGVIETKDNSVFVTRGVDGKFKINQIKDRNNKEITNSKRKPKQTATETTLQPPATSGVNKIKFYESLKNWKIKNIGPNAASVGVTYQQLKDFLKSINIQDPDRVLKSAGIQDRGARTVPNTLLSGVEATLKSRGIVSENSQISLLKQLNLLKDSYNKIYELSKHKNN